MKKGLTCLLCMALVICSVLGITMPVFAEGNLEAEFDTHMDIKLLLPSDTTWQEDYDYILDGDNIVLRKYKEDAEEVIIPQTAKIEGVTYNTKLNDDCSGLFEREKTINHQYFNSNIKTIRFENIDTSNVTNMSKMFYGCNNLKSIDVGCFNTQNVTDMSFMFGECNGLTSLDVGNFNTSKVVDMSFMFSDCKSLTYLDVRGFNTKKVINMSRLFTGCKSLSDLDVKSFDTSNVIDMSYMFADCKALRNLDLSKFDTNKVKSMEAMFYSCGRLSSLNVISFNTSSVTNMKYMFCFCSSIKNLNLTNFNTSNVTDMGYMFYGCKELRSLDLSSFDMKNVNHISNFFVIHEGEEYVIFCENLSEIKTPINARYGIELPSTFVKKDNPSFQYSYLPKNQNKSITIIKKDTKQPSNQGSGSNNKPASQPTKIGTVKVVNDAGESFTKDGSGEIRCYNKDGSQVKNDFKCDGVSTYFFQADGTAMKDRLTYHPDGVHVIYFDGEGHEVFSNFAHVKKSIANTDVDDFCFFDVYGHLYVDVLTYDQAGQRIYYANPYGVMEVNKWFQFSNNVQWADGTPADANKNQFGFANYDGTLATNGWTYDFLGRWCYLQGNGVALY